MRFGRFIMKYRFATLMTLLSIARVLRVPARERGLLQLTASQSETGEGKLLLGVKARFRVDANVRKTYPEHPYIHAQDKFAGKFGSASFIAIAVIKKDGEIYDYDFLQKVSRVTDKLDQAPDVNHYQVRSLSHINTRVIHIEPDGAIEAVPLLEEIPEDEEDLAEAQGDGARESRADLRTARLARSQGVPRLGRLHHAPARQQRGLHRAVQLPART